MRGGGFNADTISLLTSAKSRSVSPENVTGEKGGGARAERGVCSEAAHGLGGIT